MTGPLCDALTGRTDGERMLETLERANLFLVPLDERRQWYRYHHLFADCLRARMLSEEREQVQTLHHAASGWYEQHGLLEDAIAHALAASDDVRAGYLIELALPDVKRARRDAALIGWLEALPADEVRRRPVLSVYSGWMRMVAGDLDAVAVHLQDAEHALAGTPEVTWADTDELRTLPATIAVYRAALAQARGDVAGTVEQARRAFELAGPDDHFARGAGAGYLGLAAWADGDVHAALETFSQAVASLHAAGNLVDELATTVVLAEMWTAAGRPSTARRLLEDALKTAAAGDAALPLPIADLHVGLAELDREASDLASANQHLETARSLGDRASMTENRFRWFVAAAQVKQAEGDLDAALDLLDQAERVYRRGYFPEVRPIAAMKARVRIAQGDLGAAADWARSVSIDDTGYLREFDHLTLARLLLAQGRDADAIGLLDRLLEPARASGREASVVEIRMLQALARTTRGQPAGTTETLSARELQVLRLLDTELSGPEIARELYVSLNTLRTHTKHIFAKLDVTSRAAAVRRARDLGLL